jgi:ABC-type multidrug transport system fused ATPase/permease subunit
MAQRSYREKMGTLRALVRTARPYKSRFVLIAVLALLGTAADLMEPLIYRIAINDVAGLFVNRGDRQQTALTSSSQRAHKAGTLAKEQESGKEKGPVANSETAPTALPSAEKPAAAAGEKTSASNKNEAAQKAAPRQKHRRGYVAPRTPRQTLTTLLWSVVALFVIGVCGYCFSLASEYQSTVVACRIEANLIQSTFGHVLRLPLAFFNKRASGGLAKRIDQADQVAPIVSAFSQQIAPEVIRLIGICGIMFFQSWRLALAALAVLPLYFLITRQGTRRLETGMAEYYMMWENVSARIQDALASVKTVKLSGAEPREAGRLKSEAEHAYDDYIERNRIGNRYRMVQRTLTQFGQALVLGYGGWLVLEHQLTPGDVVMFVAYLDRLFDPIDSLSSLAVSLQQNMASLQRAVRLLQTGPEEARGVPLNPGPGKIEFHDVRFAYAPPREVLHGLSFTIEPGQVTALTGPSGAGKTTTADLLLKLWSPTEGTILIDDQPLQEIDPSSLRQAIGLVAADGAIFRGTLADNIRYKRPDATDEEVRVAALAAGLGPTLERLPDGLETSVGERGVGLSVGERQRLQLARILADRPRILVLDEATANLDYATEREVKQALGQLKNRPTMLVIAHRYSMIRDADYVIVLDEGRILEQGSPAELIAAEGWFARLAAPYAESAAGL